MPDIALCKGADAKLCQSCYRKLATPDPHWQTYLVTPPIRDGECERYLPVRVKREVKR